jgi:uncharacterized alkaline shock family protein YloU
MDTQGKRAVVVGAPDEVGKVHISDDVLSDIALTEAMAVEGVVAPLEHMMQGVLRRRAAHEIRLERSDRHLVFHLTVGVRGGMRIPEVANQVRERIARAVREKTGYVVQAVNLRVDHVVFDEGAAEAS